MAITWTILDNASESDFIDIRELEPMLKADERSAIYYLRGVKVWEPGTAKLGFVWSPDDGTTKLPLPVPTVPVVADNGTDDGQLLPVLPTYIAGLAKLGGTVAIRTLNTAGVQVVQTGGPLTITGYVVFL